MKILFDIRPEYTETELHICGSRRSGELLALRDSLEQLLLTKITLYRNQEAASVSAKDIVRIYSENKRVYARTASGTFEVRDRLYSLEEQLCSKGFVRISNSELVNASHILKLDMGYTGTIKVYLTNGDETYVSRRYVTSIKDVLI